MATATTTRHTHCRLCGRPFEDGKPCGCRFSTDYQLLDAIRIVRERIARNRKLDPEVAAILYRNLDKLYL